MGSLKGECIGRSIELRPRKVGPFIATQNVLNHAGAPKWYICRQKMFTESEICYNIRQWDGIKIEVPTIKSMAELLRVCGNVSFMRFSSANRFAIFSGFRVIFLLACPELLIYFHFMSRSKQNSSAVFHSPQFPNIFRTVQHNFCTCLMQE